MFKARTSRTFLTILGMSIGIGAILFLVSFGYGLQKTLLEKITTSESLLSLDVTENLESDAKLDEETVKMLGNIDGVAEISPAFQVSAQGTIEDITADLSVIGAKHSYLRLGGVNVSKGATLGDDRKDEVVISSTVAQIFGKEKSEEMIDKEISFAFFIPDETISADPNSQNKKTKKVIVDKKFKIIGIIESEDNTIYINPDALNELAINHFSQVKLKAASQDKLEMIQSQIIEKGFLVSTLSDAVDQANKVFGMVQLVLMLFGIIALTVSAIGMFNTMTIALLERTEEIGIMKSIGASNSAVSLMFIMESTIMGFMGGLGGVLIGLLGGEIINGVVNFIATRFGGQTTRLFYSPLWFIGAILLFAAVVGFLTGFVPARRASKIDPLDALRYK